MPKLVFQPNLNVNNEKTETNYEKKNSLYFYPYRLQHTFSETLCRHLVYPISLFLMAQELAIPSGDIVTRGRSTVLNRQHQQWRILDRTITTTGYLVVFLNSCVRILIVPWISLIWQCKDTSEYFDQCFVVIKLWFVYCWLSLVWHISSPTHTLPCPVAIVIIIIIIIIIIVIKMAIVFIKYGLCFSRTYDILIEEWYRHIWYL